jgi:hypothetical protein
MTTFSGTPLSSGHCAALCVVLCAAWLTVAPAVRAAETTFGGQGFMQIGRIEHSSDTASQNYNGNWTRATAAQLSLRSLVSPRLEIGAGMGVMERHFLQSRIGHNGSRNPMLFSPYIVEGRFTYAFQDEPEGALKLTGGFFHYNYNPDVKNLGSYLLRGPVWPGLIVSGFETKHTQPLANILGFRLQHRIGSFNQDFILSSETELYPLFDLSPAYVASYSFGKLLRVGAGVNFYHLIPVSRELTHPDTLASNTYPGNSDYDDRGPFYRTRIYVDFSDTAGGRVPDTTYMSFAGTKLMVNASLDIKELAGGMPALGPEDLKVYGEIALIGLDQSKAYKALYGGYRERMPVMAGVNLPAFRYLDHLALEVQWYGARFRDDLGRYQSSNATPPSPIPQRNTANLDLGRDNWKWSLHTARTLSKSVRLTAQVANDHTRPGGMVFDPSAEWQSIFVTPQDWYWMGKIAFFF